MHISRNLGQELGMTLHRVSDNDGKVLIYPDSLTCEMLVKENLLGTGYSILKNQPLTLKLHARLLQNKSIEM